MDKKIIFLSGITLVVIILVAAIYYTGQEQKEFSGNRENVTICYANTSSTALITIAKEQGFFSQNGLEVTFRQFPLGKQAVESLFRGECNIAASAEIPIILNSFNRNDFSIFATISSSENYNKIIFRNDSGIRVPDNLSGKRISTTKGTTSNFFLYTFLIKNSIAEENVTIIYKNAEELPQAMAAGEIDAASIGEPYITRTKNILGNNAAVFAEPGLSITKHNLVAFNNYIKDRPEIIDRTLFALIKAEEYVKNHENETVSILSKQYGIDGSEMSAIVNDTLFRVSLDQDLILMLEDEARWTIKTNQTNGTIFPNYLDFIRMENLEKIRPEAVTIIH